MMLLWLQVGVRMKPNEHYLDYTGSSVYCQSQIEQVRHFRRTMHVVPVELLSQWRCWACFAAALDVIPASAGFCRGSNRDAASLPVSSSCPVEADQVKLECSVFS